MTPRALMIQGCTSDAGKSLLVAGLCRALARRGVAVAPFKPQNMALNSAVAADHGEMGRAQVLQAQACFLAPHTDMNPVLLKPASDTGAQVIIHGKARHFMQAAAYHDYKPTARAAVLESWRRLCASYEALLVEGAGSPAEINLRAGDIANMGFAEAADCKVALIADIERGGVFAHLIGTLQLLSKSERARVCGFVINKFRGDIALLQPGLDWLARETGKPVLGVLPYLPGLHLDAEDAVDAAQAKPKAGALKVAVPVLSRISNHTDFDALRLHPQVDLRFVPPARAIPPCDLIILPGSKNTRRDLHTLRENNWHRAIERHLRYGGKVMGICGGYQMLGSSIADPAGVEDRAGTSAGLRLLDAATELTARKKLQNVRGVLALESAPAAGYFIHCGVTRRAPSHRPLIRLADGATDGMISDDGQIIGAYLHGLFDHPPAARALLRWGGLQRPRDYDRNAARELALNRLADCVETHCAKLLPLALADAKRPAAA